MVVARPAHEPKKLVPPTPLVRKSFPFGREILIRGKKN